MAGRPILAAGVPQRASEGLAVAEATKLRRPATLVVEAADISPVAVISVVGATPGAVTPAVAAIPADITDRT